MNAFVFDMDGVLIDNSDFHVRAWTEYSRQYGRELSVDDIKSRLGFNNREYMRFVLGREPTEAEVVKSTVEKEALAILVEKGVTIVDCDRDAFRRRVAVQGDDFIKAMPASKPIIETIRATSV